MPSNFRSTVLYIDIGLVTCQPCKKLHCLLSGADKVNSCSVWVWTTFATNLWQLSELNNQNQHINLVN